MTTAIAVNPCRRDVLLLTTGAIAAVGAAAAAWPLVSQMSPDASTVAAGLPIAFDLAPIAVGQVIKLLWRGRPIFIMQRTAWQIVSARKTDWMSLRDPQPDEARVKAGHEQWLVVLAI